MLPAPLQQQAAAASTSKAATTPAACSTSSTTSTSAAVAAVRSPSLAPRAAALPAVPPARPSSCNGRRRAASGLAAGVSGREALGYPGIQPSFSFHPAAVDQHSSPFSAATATLSPQRRRRSWRRSRGGPAPPAASSSSFSSPEDSTSPSKAAAAAAAAAPKRKWSGLARRAASGVALGAGAAATIALGGWVLCVVACLVVYQASVEYYGLVTSQGLVGGAGMTPPTKAAAAVATWCCVGIALWTHLSRGKVTAALAVASFIVLSVSLLGNNNSSSSSSSSPSSTATSTTVSGRPRFAQLTSSVFGLFYCGYLPSFWIKLRLLAAPAAGAGATSALAARWPSAFGGPTAFTVGLAATLLSVVCVIAADTGAYFTGKSVGRTQLTPASPKKTVEGAAGGLASAVAAALLMRLLLGWPANYATALSLGVLVFGASLFGDLLESVIKRDAGLKDAGDLIPGHGGLLDRFDSYIFTGAIVFFVIRFVLPVFGL